jgi:periodic tryptophan protein 1
MEALVEQHSKMQIKGGKERAEESDEDSEQDMGEGDEVETKEEEEEEEDDAAVSMHTSAALGNDDGDAAILKELGMDNYDEEEEVVGAELFLGGHNLTVFQSNEEDPYIQVPDDEDESDEEDLVIKPTDGVIVVGKTEEEQSSIEVHVYTEEDGNLFVHHDFPLPSFPLCVQWLDFDHRSPEEKGSLLAVGTFLPGIEIWNLDVMDNVEPICVLGGRLEPDPALIADLKFQLRNKNKKDKKPLKKRLKEAVLGKFIENSHKDAVMCMGWHQAHRERLASGSADGTIKIWNLATKTCEATLTHHTSKVQSLEWNPAEPSLLLSGAFDRSIAVLDVRAPTSVKKFQVDSDIECVRWCPLQPFMFLASTENGTVTCHDARDLSKPKFTLGAHTKACSALAWNPVAQPVLFATGSLDQTVKLWAILETGPTMLASKNIEVGAVYSVAFDSKEGNPFLLVGGGNKGKTAVWDTLENESISSYYGKLGFGDRNTNRKVPTVST